MTLDDLKTLATAVRTAPTLTGLRDALNTLQDGFKAYNADYDRQDIWHDIDWQDVGLDLTQDLPVFEGKGPADTTGIWSWDARSVLIDDAQSKFVIEPREGR